MKWSNLFSYGENNEVDFSENPLTQIVGLNGHGKTSIALILEEVLYNKNSKGIKKADIINRNNNSKNYTIELSFDKDGDSYHIKTVRGSTQTVKLTCNEADISSHTSTGTYKSIEELIGYDHKTFTQIVYQSSAASLEFLTATDSNRKKFLIDLLGLSRYVDYGDVFKAGVKELELEIAGLSSKIHTTQSWIDKYKSADLSLKQLLPVPLENPRELVEKVSEIKETIKTIDTTNKKIVQNNKYKELLDATTPEPVGRKPELDTTQLTADKAENSKSIKDAEAFIQKMKKLGTSCPTCLQEVNSLKVRELVAEQEQIVVSCGLSVKHLETVLKDYELKIKEWTRCTEVNKQYETLYNLYDTTMSTKVLDKVELEAEIQALERVISDISSEIKRVTTKNAEISAHNAKAELICSQLEDNQASLLELKGELEVLNDRLSTLQVLVKTFSSTGLVAYKIECLVKDLEEVTNTYLQELSSGRFQISFRVSSSDKLNVVISDHGKDIEMLALSGGERARVNAAALLGIRKLMQSLSNTRINLLVLDETIENLDLEGKEKLVEVLLSEPYLNTFVISHGFQHPLLSKLQVIKHKNISRIEHG
jgi:DNA repair exonuclease SbcCD ATPase subunit